MGPGAQTLLEGSDLAMPPPRRRRRPLSGAPLTCPSAAPRQVLPSTQARLGCASSELPGPWALGGLCTREGGLASPVLSPLAQDGHPPCVSLLPG